MHFNRSHVGSRFSLGCCRHTGIFHTVAPRDWQVMNKPSLLSANAGALVMILDYCNNVSLSLFIIACRLGVRTQYPHKQMRRLI